MPFKEREFDKLFNFHLRDRMQRLDFYFQQMGVELGLYGIKRTIKAQVDHLAIAVFGIKLNKSIFITSFRVKALHLILSETGCEIHPFGTDSKAG